VVEAALARVTEDRTPEAEDLVEGFLSTLACKAAVKAGDPLSHEQVADLLAAAEALEHSHTCPHGRPTELVLTYSDLERHFKRK
jgi:DNA mismatch repair protein MutL